MRADNSRPPSLGGRGPKEGEKETEEEGDRRARRRQRESFSKEERDIFEASLVLLTVVSKTGTGTGQATKEEKALRRNEGGRKSARRLTEQQSEQHKKDKKDWSNDLEKRRRER